MKEYTERAKVLLSNSANDVNPYEGYVPNVPVGEKINFSSFEEVAGYEAIGREELRQTAFVLGKKMEIFWYCSFLNAILRQIIIVAGGLGERLNYNGIKIGI